jgi:protein FRG1
MWLI